MDYEKEVNRLIVNNEPIARVRFAQTIRDEKGRVVGYEGHGGSSFAARKAAKAWERHHTPWYQIWQILKRYFRGI